MSGWTLWQFASVVQEFATEADDDMWGEMLARLVRLQELGNELSYPASEPIRDGIFALRAKSRAGQSRLLFFFMTGRRIVFVHSLRLKRTRTLPQADIEIALQRRKRVLEADRLEQIAKLFTVDGNENYTH